MRDEDPFIGPPHPAFMRPNRKPPLTSDRIRAEDLESIDDPFGRGYQIRRRLEDGTIVCGAPLTPGGDICCNTDAPLTERSLCYEHRFGPEERTWRNVRDKNGKWRFTDHPVASAEKRAAVDPGVLSLARACSLYDMRIEELSARMVDGDMPAYRKSVLQALRKYKSDRDNDRPTKSAWNRLEKMVIAGADSEDAWNELLKVTDKAQRHKAQAAELSLKHNHYMKRSDVVGMLAKIQEAQFELLPDDQFAALSERLIEIVSLSDNPELVKETRESGSALVPRVSR